MLLCGNRPSEESRVEISDAASSDPLILNRPTPRKQKVSPSCLYLRNELVLTPCQSSISEDIMDSRRMKNIKNNRGILSLCLIIFVCGLPVLAIESPTPTQRTLP